MRRGWSQEELADELQDHGSARLLSTWAMLEKGGTRAAARISVVRALAAALVAPPVDLLMPYEDGAYLAVTPNRIVTVPVACACIRSYTVLPGSDFDARLRRH